MANLAAMARFGESPVPRLARDRFRFRRAKAFRQLLNPRLRTGANPPILRPTQQIAMNKGNILDQVRVASPCNARWEDMTGDDRARFCGHCQKHVFNLSALTRREAEQLVREKEGGFCGRFHQRRDGRMLTADCPSGLRRCRERLGFICAVVIGGLTFLLTGCRRPVVMGRIASPPALTGEVQVSPPAPANPPAIMGDIAIVPAPAPNSTNASSGK